MLTGCSAEQEARETLPPVLEVTSDKGKILNPVAQPNGETGGWRLSFELEPGSETQAELRAVLRLGDEPLAESWVYRWTA